MRSLALTPAQQRRIAKLAQLAGRTPESMLRFVLREVIRHKTKIKNDQG